MTHFITYRKKILNKISGFRIGFDGSQDYDLVLRATEITNKIDHIAKILYGWRQIPTSTSFSQQAKPYTKNATIKLLEDMLTRRQISGRISYDDITTYNRIIYEIIGDPLVSIIIITHDSPELLGNLLESIEKRTSYKNYELIIIDRKSEQEKTKEFLQTVKHTVIRFNGEYNYSKVVNFASKFVKGEHILFMNDDMEVINDDWIDALLEHSQRPDIGVVGNLLLYPKNNNDGQIQHAGVILGLHGVCDHCFKNMKLDENHYFNYHRIIRNCIAVTGACIMIKKKLFDEVNGWDENLAIVYNDVDFCIRISEKGYRTIYTPFSKLYHFEGASRKKIHPKEDEEYFIKKWQQILLLGDKYYNANLSLLNDYLPSPYSDNAPAIKALMETFYSRPDLQAVFPEALSGNYDKLMKWVLDSGLNEPPTSHLLNPYKYYYQKMISENIVTTPT
jgi:GT2 family glycosyltransferase